MFQDTFKDIQIWVGNEVSEFRCESVCSVDTSKGSYLCIDIIVILLYVHMLYDVPFITYMRQLLMQLMGNRFF